MILIYCIFSGIWLTQAFITLADEIECYKPLAKILALAIGLVVVRQLPIS